MSFFSYHTRTFVVTLFAVVVFAGAGLHPERARADTTYYSNWSCGTNADFPFGEYARSITFSPSQSFELKELDLEMYSDYVSGYKLFKVSIYEGASTTDPLTQGYLVDSYEAWEYVPYPEASATTTTFSLWDGVYLYEGHDYTFVIENESWSTTTDNVTLHGDSSGCVGYNDTETGMLYRENAYPTHEYLEWFTVASQDWHIAVKMRGVPWGNNEFNIDAVVWGSEGETIHELDCLFSETNTPSYCSSEINLDSLLVFATTSSLIVDSYYYNLKLQNLQGLTYSPESYYDVTTYYEETGEHYLTKVFMLPLTASSTYKLQGCVGATLADWETHDVFCGTLYIGNGYASSTFNALMTNSGVGTPTEENPWIANGCDDLTITDVGGGLKCAFLWAFQPSTASIDKFKNLSLSSKMPFSYVYDMGTIQDELFNASSSSSTISVPIKWVGGTTTMTFLSADMIDAWPISGTMRTILGYAIWFMLAMHVYRRVLKIHDVTTQVA